MSHQLQKKQLRGLIKSVLKELPRDSISAQSRTVARRIADLPEFVAAKNIALYLHMDKELQTDALAGEAFRQNKRVFLPRICALDSPQDRQHPKQKTHLKMLEVTSMNQIRSLEPQGKYQIREPQVGTNCFDAGGLDLIIVPGVAFAANGARMGHGAGFYDSFVTEHEKVVGKRPVLIGVGLKEQLVEDLPLEPHDKMLDVVVVGDEVFRSA